MKKGDIIMVDFVARLESGEVVDLTKEDVAKQENIYNKNVEYRPMPVLIGEGLTLKGLEEELIQMKDGEEKKIEILPEKGFGKRNPRLVKLFPAKAFGDRVPMTGMIIELNGLKGRVQFSMGGRVRIDFNHPLAGKKIIYNLKIIRKVDDDKEGVEKLCELFSIKTENIDIADGKAVIKAGKLPDPVKKKIIEMIKTHTKLKDASIIE